MSGPIVYEWDGIAMVPLPRFAKRCDQLFVVGERYGLVEESDRSQATHNHYFASLHDLWLNLPETAGEESFEHFRKRGLIATGYCTVTDIVFSSIDDAFRAAKAIQDADAYLIVVVEGNVVRFMRAESQSRKAMGAKRFNESKRAVLDWAAAQVGVSADQAGMAA